MLSRSQPSSILYWEMNSPSTGIIWITSSVTMKLVRPRNRNRLTATAARNAKTSATATVSDGDHQADLERVEEPAALEAPAGSCRGCRRTARQVGSGARISLRGSSEVLTIQ